MEIVYISDTHWLIKDSHDRKKLTNSIPDGDCIVHAGDVSGRGTEGEIRMFLDWYNSLPHRIKIFIAGNHDFIFEVAPARIEEILKDYPDIIYLNDSGIEIEGIKFWGSPITPWFHNWAFNRLEDEIKPHWDPIPGGVDVLITHGPPRGILDLTTYDKLNVGCPVLLKKVKQIKPRVHVFGHIHEGRGTEEIDGTIYINASVVDLKYNLYPDVQFSFRLDPTEPTDSTLSST